jgi:hypothetical protein
MLDGSAGRRMVGPSPWATLDEERRSLLDSEQLAGLRLGELAQLGLGGWLGSKR